MHGTMVQLIHNPANTSHTSFSLHRTMPNLFPNLPQDVWPHITRRLTPRDLSSLALTSTSLYRQVTSEELFQHEYLSQNQVPSSNVTFANLYRRSRAIFKEPSEGSSFSPFDSLRSYRLVACIADRVFLTDGVKLFCFPEGWSVHLENICKNDIVQCAVPMQRGLGVLAGFKKSKDGPVGGDFAMFRILDLATGNLIDCTWVPVGKCGVYTGMDVVGAISPGRAIFAGGAEERFLVYFVNDGKELKVVDMKTRACVRNFEVTSSGTFGRLVREGSRLVAGSFVVGGIIEQEEGPKGTKTLIRNLDGGVEEIATVDGGTVVDVLRSRNGFLAWRVKCGASLRLWRAESGKEDQMWPIHVGNAACTTLLEATTEFMMTDEGKHLFLLPRGLLSYGLHDGRVMRMTFREQGSLTVDSLKGQMTPSNLRWSWATVCGGGRIVLAASFKNGLFSAFDMAEGKRIWTLTCEERVSEAVLVGEHYLVAVASSGRVYCWHFDAYCQNERMGPGEFTVGSCTPLFH